MFNSSDITGIAYEEALEILSNPDGLSVLHKFAQTVDQSTTTQNAIKHAEHVLEELGYDGSILTDVTDTPVVVLQRNLSGILFSFINYSETTNIAHLFKPTSAHIKQDPTGISVAMLPDIKILSAEDHISRMTGIPIDMLAPQQTSRNLQQAFILAHEATHTQSGFECGIRPHVLANEIPCDLTPMEAFKKRLPRAEFQAMMVEQTAIRSVSDLMISIAYPEKENFNHSTQFHLTDPYRQNSPAEIYGACEQSAEMIRTYIRDGDEHITIRSCAAAMEILEQLDELPPLVKECLELFVKGINHLSPYCAEIAQNIRPRTEARVLSTHIIDDPREITL